MTARKRWRGITKNQQDLNWQRRVDKHFERQRLMQLAGLPVRRFRASYPLLAPPPTGEDEMEDRNKQFTRVTREKARELMSDYVGGLTIPPEEPALSLPPGPPWNRWIGPLTRGVKGSSYWQYMDGLSAAYPMPFCWQEAAG